jgi:host factor-I protein
LYSGSSAKLFLIKPINYFLWRGTSGQRYYGFAPRARAFLICSYRPTLCFVYNSGMPFRTPPGNPNAVKRSRTPPPEDTFEEASFLKALGEKQKPVNIKLMDGQTVRGWVEYYDKNMVRLTREGAPNLFIFKHEIMYIMEDSGKQK